MAVETGVLGKAIRDARIKNDFSQEAFSEIIGITPTHLKHIESEHRKPSIDVLFRIAQTLHLSLDNILFPQNDLLQAKMKECVNLLSSCSVGELQVMIDLVQSLKKNLNCE